MAIEMKSNDKIIDAGSMAANLSSSVVSLSEVSGYCIHAVYTGAPVGTLFIEGSCDGSNFSTIASNAISGASQYFSNQSGVDSMLKFGFLKNSRQEKHQRNQ